MQNSLRLLVGLVLLALSALAWSSALAQSAGAVTAAPDPFGFRESEYSAWGIVDADYPYTGRVGCFPVGNGVIFATLGVDPDFNQLGSLTGPGYQTRDDCGAASYWQEGNWPAMPVYLVRVHAGRGAAAGYAIERVAWQRQSIQQLRGAAMVRTIQRNGGSDAVLHDLRRTRHAGAGAAVPRCLARSPAKCTAWPLTAARRGLMRTRTRRRAISG